MGYHLWGEGKSINGRIVLSKQVGFPGRLQMVWTLVSQVRHRAASEREHRGCPIELARGWDPPGPQTIDFRPKQARWQTEASYARDRTAH